MTDQPTPPSSPASPPQQPPEKQAPSETKELLKNLREVVSGKKKVGDMVKELLANYRQLPPEERRKTIIRILGLAALSSFFGIKPDKDKEGGKDKPQDQTASTSTETPGNEKPEQAKEKDPMEERQEVGCDDRRLSLIQCDPAGSRAPRVLRHNPTYLTAYGVAKKYEVFKEEVTYIIAPDAKNEKEAMKKTISVLRASPMGKYQCMPQYLFPYVERFKHLNWKKEGQNEEKLHAVWEFLQDESIQREACHNYILDLNLTDPMLLGVGYYAGADDIPKIRRYLAGQSTDKERESMEKDQGIYDSKLKYGRDVAARYRKLVAQKNIERKKRGEEPDQSFDIELMVDAIGWKESYSYRGKTKPRDEKWKKDKRFKYNQDQSSSTKTPVA